MHFSIIQTTTEGMLRWAVEVELEQLIGLAIVLHSQLAHMLRWDGGLPVVLAGLQVHFRHWALHLEVDRRQLLVHTGLGNVDRGLFHPKSTLVQETPVLWATGHSSPCSAWVIFISNKPIWPVAPVFWSVCVTLLEWSFCSSNNCWLLCLSRRSSSRRPLGEAASLRALNHNRCGRLGHRNLACFQIVETQGPLHTWCGSDLRGILNQSTLLIAAQVQNGIRRVQLVRNSRNELLNLLVPLGIISVLNHSWLRLRLHHRHL
mmetsp:Transcript_20085/g.29041  ORF Transcript_20085/g.29041 Transcript_20085/m.29041 type:complete len:261 (+) Transcript_20085:645-1427(+)